LMDQQGAKIFYDVTGRLAFLGRDSISF